MSMRGAIGLVACIAAVASWAHGRSGAADQEPIEEEGVVSALATGTFEVKLEPSASDDEPGGASLGRFSLEKRFHGDLEGTGTGEMLSARTQIEESAGYVAIERVSGTLHGHSGSFVLQHSGTMNRGAQRLVITVVPDSGTGELEGLAGEMRIAIADGQHNYEFDYTIGERSE